MASVTQNGREPPPLDDELDDDEDDELDEELDELDDELLAPEDELDELLELDEPEFTVMPYRQ